MRKPKLLLIAYRAFGDWLCTVPVLPFLFEKYDVHLECNRKVYALSFDDPRFCGITAFDDVKYIKKLHYDETFDKNKAMEEHLQSVYDSVNPDLVIDLSNTHERKCISVWDQKEFHLSQAERHEVFGTINYYDSVFEHCKIPIPKKMKLDTMFFSEDQESMVKRWRERHTSDFLVIIPPLGSCMQKFYPRMTDVINHIVDVYHNAHVYLMGEAGITEGSLNHERIHDMTGKIGMKQSILMTKYADYVLGPETGLMLGAGMFGTPKTMLLNTVYKPQICSKHENDYSLQSSHSCSPCYRGIYEERDCEDIMYSDGTPYSGCVHSYDFDEICSIIKTVYEKRNIYNRDYFERYAERAKTEIGKRIYNSRWGLIEKYCHGNLRLLDFGCASGAFHRSSRNGFITTGYDINPNSPYHKTPEDKADILTMWDVIEHLHDPLEAIKKFQPQYVFITTPNLHEGVDFNTWKHNRPNEHLHYFTETSLSGLLQDNGYKVIESNFDEGAIRDTERPKDIITVAAVKCA